jgi:uncharacterized membrane protein
MVDVPSQSGPTSNNSGQGSGLDPNIASALTYLCGVITAIIFLLVEKTNKTVRFHAWQSLFFSLGVFVINIALNFFSFFLTQIAGILGVLIAMITMIFGLGVFILWIVLMIKAYQGSTLTLPVVSDLARKQVDKEA